MGMAASSSTTTRPNGPSGPWPSEERITCSPEILFAGGECRPKDSPRGGQTFDDVTGYDPDMGRWTTLASLPSRRHAFAAGTVGHTAYFAAGAPTCGGAYSAALLAFTLR
jgi:hypothetical protein